ncbi:MAG: pyruvate ferredoxin oxidoreductase, partial [Endomicrobiales bacterium]
MANIKELSRKEDQFTGGHRLCSGCGAGIIARQAMLAANKPVVVTSATGCLEVSSTIFPYSAWQVPFIHSAFENAAATASGVEAAYRSLNGQGKVTG